jgi:hypothetical protein
MVARPEPRVITPTDGNPEDRAIEQSGSTADVTLRRLNSQIRWYDQQASLNNVGHKSLRVVSLAAAATIPVLAALSAPAVAAAILGAGIVVLEGMQGLFQFSRNSVAFGVTRESLKREKYLYLASAGAYARSRNPDRLLAEQIEALVAQETSAWASVQHNVDGATHDEPH